MHTGTQQKEDALFRVATTHKLVCRRRSSLSLQRQTCKQIFSILVVLISVKETCMPLCIKVGYLVLVLFKCVTPICQENGIYLNFDLFIIYFPIIPKCQLSHISDWHVTAEWYNPPSYFSRGRFTLFHTSMWFVLGRFRSARLSKTDQNMKQNTESYLLLKHWYLPP